MILPGIEISLDALTERGAKLPKIDLAEPRGVIGKSTVDAIRSGILYGYAGAIDGILGRLREGAGRGAWTTIATGGLSGRIVPLTEHDRRGRRPPHAHRPAPHPREERARLLALGGVARAPDRALDAWAGSRSRTASCSPRWRGSATGSCACRPSASAPGSRSRRWSRASRSTTATRRRAWRCSACTPRSATTGRCRSSCSARTRTSCARPPRHVAEHTDADMIDLNMGCPVPKVMKTGAGAAMLKDHDTAVAVAKAAHEGSGLPVTVKLRSRRQEGRHERADARAPPRRRGGRRRHHLPPAQRAGPPQGLARPRPRQASSSRRSTRR